MRPRITKPAATISATGSSRLRLVETCSRDNFLGQLHRQVWPSREAEPNCIDITGDEVSGQLADSATQDKLAAARYALEPPCAREELKVTFASLRRNTIALPFGKNTMAFRICDDAATLSARLTILQIDIHHARTNQLGRIEAALPIGDKHDAAESTDKQRLILTNQINTALALPRCGGLQLEFFSRHHGANWRRDDEQQTQQSQHWYTKIHGLLPGQNQMTRDFSNGSPRFAMTVAQTIGFMESGRKPPKHVRIAQDQSNWL